MPRKKENHLKSIVFSLNKEELKAIKNHLKNSSTSNAVVKLELLKMVLKNKDSEVEFFLKKHAVSVSKFNTIKFQLFNDILNVLVKVFNQDKDRILNYNQAKFDLLLQKGVFKKAYRVLLETIELAYELYDYDICYRLQLKAHEHGLFDLVGKKIHLTEMREKLKNYHLLSYNLNQYKILAEEVLFQHYEYQDQRIDNRNNYLELLNHPLLLDENQAISMISKYYFLRIKSIIHLGDNNFESSRKFSLLAYKHLSKHATGYRNDKIRLLRSLNNYLDASLHLGDKKAFDIYFPKILDLVSSHLSGDFYFELHVFQFLTSIRLNYQWLTKDTITFKNEVKEYERQLNIYLEYLSPNIKLEILLGLARMYYLTRELEKGNAYCIRVIAEKNNPASIYIVCANLLRIMINFDMHNYKLIPHLINTSKYSLKNRNRLFELERTFLNGLKNIKLYNEKTEKYNKFKKLYTEISGLMDRSNELIIDKKIDLLSWLDGKCKNPNNPKIYL